MSQSLLIQVNGLNTNANQLSKVAPGSLSIAKNCIIDKDGVVESRRGMDFYPNSPANLSFRHDRLFEYQNVLLAHRSNNNTLAYYNGSGWTEYNSGASFPNVDNDFARMRFLKTAGNLYFTTSSGVKVLDAYNGTVYSTGMPKGLDGTLALTGVTGWMAKNAQVAYRIIWGSRDANNNLYFGAPSQRIIVTNPNTGHSQDVSVTFTIPSGITVNDFYQVYRSKVSASESDPPNDELQLVYESNPTAGEITAKAISFTDSCPESLLGAYLYTNASQEGISEANNEPPVAADICLFKGYTFYLNIRTNHKLNISLLAVDAGTGVTLNDTIVINGMTFTAKGSETIASGYFKYFTSGSAAQNIEDTSRSLVKVINQYTGNTTIYAYYESGYGDLPGQILLEKRVIDQTAFTVTVNKATAWNLDDGTSDNENFINGLAWSKDGQAEHVPVSHLQKVGSDNFSARRILALRDSVFILKEDGVFRLTGSAGSWTIAPFDTSTKIIAPDTAVVCNNQIYCLTDQGIVAISDLGVEIKSIPIENQLKEIISFNYDNFKKLSFGINYETDRKYIFFCISTESDSYPTKAYCFNTINMKWSSWEKNLVHGFCNTSDDKLYFAQGGTEHILQERKDFKETDYCDEAITGYSISSYNDKDVILASVTGAEVGDVIYQSATVYAIITAIDIALKKCTTNSAQGWTLGACTLIKAIDCELEFTVITNDNPGLMKHYQEIAWLFREKGFSTAKTSFYTDLSGGYDDTTIYGDYGGGGWGSFAWGTIPWGGILRAKATRVFVPREKSRGSLLSVKLQVKNAFARWSLNALSVQFEMVSEKMTRY